MSNLICLIFGHRWITLWCQESGYRCFRCGELKDYKLKPKEEWAK